MKKFLSILLIAGISGLVACGPSEEEKKKMEEEAAAAVEEMLKDLETEMDQAVEEATEEMAEHVCNEHCTEEGCHFMHGEKGHVCSDECAGMGHDHEGEVEEISEDEEQ